MTDLILTKLPEVKAGMLIRKPPAVVFNAFIDPEITKNFWFTNGSATLEQGMQVEWTWQMYGFSVQVDVKEIEPDERILVEWGTPEDRTSIEWTFAPHENHSTYVSITNSGFKGDADSVVAKALDSCGGFTTVLDGAKAWLEHGINLNLILDKFPKAPQ